MKIFIRIGLAVSFATLSVADNTFHRRIKDLTLKRDYLTCLETYGGGSTTCGNKSSHYCYDPTLRESCCPLDDGYCKAGDFCAPEAGYCCHNGEDPATCAARLSFTLPPSSSTMSRIISMTDYSVLTDIAVASKTPVTTTSTIEVLAAASSSVPSSTVSSVSVPVAIFGALGTKVLTATSPAGLTPDFTALVNHTAPSATVSAGLGAGIIQFTGTARRMDLGMSVEWVVGGLLGGVAVAGLIL